jgi:TonB family protein
VVVHALGVLAVFAVPAIFTGQALARPIVERDPIRYVQMTPLADRSAKPERPVEHSDRDRRSASPIRPLNPENTAPYSRGNTPEKTEAPPPQPPADGTDALSVQSAAAAAATAMPSKVSPDAPALPAGPSKNLGAMLTDLQRYLKDENFNNQRGGLTDQDPDIQFDSKGVEFGPWLRRFVAQVKSNWFIPQAAMSRPGRVVIQFHIQKNGTIRDLQVVKPSAIEGYTTAAFNALRLSNPTMPLPAEYPADAAFFTVTFHYNERYP